MNGLGPEIESGRVAQLIVDREGRLGARGSGYRVSDTVVLTAEHVVKGGRGVRVVFNADQPGHWEASGTVALRSAKGDVALVIIDPPEPHRKVEPVRFGRIGRRAAVLSCRAVGFPLFKMRPDPGKDVGSPAERTWFRDAHHVEGKIATLSNSRSRTLEITVDQPGVGSDKPASPWEGMSGAAVWCGDLIVGVVSLQHSTDGLNRLAGVRADEWYNQLAVDDLTTLKELLGLPDELDELTETIAHEADRQLAEFSRGRTRRRLPALDSKYEAEVAEWFVTPPEWATTVMAALRDSTTVLLHGEPGTGRRTAAIRLLSCHGRGRRQIQQLSPQVDEPGHRCLDPTEVVEGDRLLLDLSAVEEAACMTVLGGLADFRNTLIRRKADLVVVLPACSEQHVRRELREPVVQISRPDSAAVFKAHLKALDVQYVNADPPERLAPFLDSASMTKIANLAWLVSEARRQSQSTSFLEWLEQALEAELDRADDVATQVEQQTDGRMRAMLLASAMLEEADPEELFEAQRLLLHTVRFPTRRAHELELPDLRTRLAQAKGGPRDTSGTGFAGLNYAQAVRRHFWTHFPGLRDGFRDWVIECGRQLRLEGELGEKFVSYYADECLRHRRADDLITTIERWTTADGADQTRLASIALERGLTNPQGAWGFRKKCYMWSINWELASSLAFVVIVACVDVIAPNYPDQAIVRLHHLARHRDSVVAQAAWRELHKLTEDHRFFRGFLARLTDPNRNRLRDLREQSFFLAEVDVRRLAHPTDSGRTLFVDTGVRQQLVVGWRAVLGVGHTSERQARVGQWLDVCSQNGDYELLDLLIAACGTEFEHQANLYDAGHRWLDQHGRAADVAVRRTIQRLDRGI